MLGLVLGLGWRLFCVAAITFSVLHLVIVGVLVAMRIESAW